MARATTDGGETWAAQTLDYGHQLGALACPAPGVCQAGDEATTDGGSTWLAQGGPVASGIACPTTRECVAVDYDQIAAYGNPTPGPTIVALLPAGTVGTAYLAGVVSSDTWPWRWSLSAGSLPPRRSLAGPGLRRRVGDTHDARGQRLHRHGDRRCPVGQRPALAGHRCCPSVHVPRAHHHPLAGRDAPSTVGDAPG